MIEYPLIVWGEAANDSKVSHVMVVSGGGGGEGATDMIVYKGLMCVTFLIEVIAEWAV